jgi:hypothetical protein
MQAVKHIGSKLTIWTLSLLVVLGLPATSWIYWPAVGAAGVLSPEADAIIIPMVESIFLAALLVPVIALAAGLSLRKQHGPIKLAAWDRERPIYSGVITLVFAVPFTLAAGSLYDELTAPPGWRGIWWLPYTSLVLAWLLLVRGAFLSKRPEPLNHDGGG